MSIKVAQKWFHQKNDPKNVGDLGKLINHKGIKKYPKLQKIALSGHTENSPNQATFDKTQNILWLGSYCFVNCTTTTSKEVDFK